MSTTKNNKSDFSDRLRLLRGNLTQAEMAKNLGFTSQQTYQNYEKGRIPKPAILQQIAQQFDVSVEWLLSGTNPQHAQSSNYPKESPSGGEEKDERMEARLQEVREFNAALAPALRALVRQTLRQIDASLSNAAINDGRMQEGMMRHCHEHLDAFSTALKEIRSAEKPETEL